MKNFTAIFSRVYLGHVLEPDTAALVATITSGPIRTMIGRTVEIHVTREQALQALKKGCRKDDIAAAIADLKNHLATNYPA